MTDRTITVDQIMTRALITARSDEDIDDADFEMRFSDVRHLPIVDEHNRLCGVVSARDVARALVGRNGRPVRIRDIMKAPLTLLAGTPVLEALKLMLDRKIGCVPVVDAKDRLVGLVTETDILRLAREVLFGQIAEPRKAS